MAAPFQAPNGPRSFRPSGFYVFQPRPPPTAAFPAGVDFDGKRVRKTLARRTVDYNSAVCKMLKSRVFQRDFRDAQVIQPEAAYYTMVCKHISFLYIF